MSVFWSNTGKGERVFIKDVGAALTKDYEPTAYQIVLITKVGKFIWEYTSKDQRDSDIEELNKMRKEYNANKN